MTFHRVFVVPGVFDGNFPGVQDFVRCGFPEKTFFEEAALASLKSPAWFADRGRTGFPGNPAFFAERNPNSNLTWIDEMKFWACKPIPK